VWLAMGKGGGGGADGAFPQIHGRTLEAPQALEGWSLEGLEAAPTPSSAVTGMKRGGPSLALFYTCRDAPDVGLVRG
jgi:hypothetical protein